MYMLMMNNISYIFIIHFPLSLSIYIYDLMYFSILLYIRYYLSVIYCDEMVMRYECFDDILLERVQRIIVHE